MAGVHVHGGLYSVLTTRAFIGWGDGGLWFFCVKLLLGARVGHDIHKLHEARKSYLDFLKMAVRVIPRWYHSTVSMADTVHNSSFSRRYSWTEMEE
jgi:hypothetical protein